MAFPILAVLAAAASDLQSRQAEQEAINQAGVNTHQRILRTRASQLGGEPYSGMAADLNGQFADIRSQADASRNNNIGNMLQAYLKQPSAPTETIGGTNSDGSLGFNHGMGGGPDPWDDDPWGDAGF